MAYMIRFDFSAIVFLICLIEFPLALPAFDPRFMKAFHHVFDFQRTVPSSSLPRMAAKLKGAKAKKSLGDKKARRGDGNKRNNPRAFKAASGCVLAAMVVQAIRAPPSLATLQMR
eukprot:6181678-Pleurochrysis_carterae.AAC.2